MAYRLYMQARGYTEGVLAYVVYEGCWCKKHEMYDFVQPCLLKKLVRGMKSMKWRLVGSSNPETHRFEQADATVKYAVASQHRMRLRF